MSGLFGLLKLIMPLLAAVIVGNWFLGEAKRAKLAGKPWYTPYLTIPGLLVLIALMIPFVLWVIKS
jgi:H+/Cl- antiporter ClcA